MSLGESVNRLRETWIRKPEDVRRDIDIVLDALERRTQIAFVLLVAHGWAIKAVRKCECPACLLARAVLAEEEVPA